MTDTDLIVKYTRLNLSTIKSMLTRPNAFKDIMKKLTTEMPRSELADLIGPLIIQRAQGTIQESGLKKGIDAVLASLPAKKEEEKFQQDQLRGKPVVDLKVKTSALIPFSLSGFKDDHANQVAAELYDKYSRQFSVGQAIAMTRRDLNRTDLDLTLAPRPEREVPRMPESKPVHHPVEHPSLFSRDEIKYASGQIVPMSYSDLDEVCRVAYESFKDTVDWPEQSFVHYLEAETWIDASWVAKDDGRIVGGYCINDHPLRLPQLKGMRGLQGVALFVLPEYRGTGLGRQLREKIKTTNPDYVWGQHLESLNNLDKWVAYGREHVGTENGIHYTLQILKGSETKYAKTRPHTWSNRKVGYAEFYARELEVGDYFVTPESPDVPMKVLTKDISSGYVTVSVMLEEVPVVTRLRYPTNKILYLGRRFDSAASQKAPEDLSLVARTHKN